MREAIEVVLEKVEALGIGKRQVNYKMRDAGWSRQRYWGEPFPSSSKMRSLTRWIRRSCRWSSRPVMISSLRELVKVHWRISRLGEYLRF